MVPYLLVSGELKHQSQASLLFASVFNVLFSLLANIVVSSAGVHESVAEAVGEVGAACVSAVLVRGGWLKDVVHLSRCL